MKALELIGAVGAASLRDLLASVNESDGVALLILDCLTGDQTAAIVRAVLNDKSLSDKLTIAMPRELVAGQGLPDTVVTDERTVHLRHGDCATPALLLANTEDDQRASLQDISLLGSRELIRIPELWVEAAAHGLTLPDGQLETWKAALQGLMEAEERALTHVAHFVELTRLCIEEQGKPVADALGWALPALQFPRDPAYFLALKPKDHANAARWKSFFQKLGTDRKMLLLKQRPSRQPIEADELRSQWEEIRDEVNAALHATFTAFIEAPAGWNDATAQLAELEWESDGVGQLFSGLKQKRSSLPEETLRFYDEECSECLGDGDRQYLEQLQKLRALRAPLDVDREFFEKHRQELAPERALRAKWEKFVFGKAVDCTDFLDGLLQVLERLYNQSPSLVGRRSLLIRTNRQRVSQWSDLNADVGMAFAVRYRGLPALTEGCIRWDTSRLFDFEKFLEERRQKDKKYKLNDSKSRASRQIKFEITLTVGEGAQADSRQLQLVWTGDTTSIGLELPADLGRLARRPFVRMEVGRETVGKKGQLQTVDLNDVGSLQSAFARDAGSLIGRVDGAQDIGREFETALAKLSKEGRISAVGKSALQEAWGAFAGSYENAIKAMRGDGLSAPVLLIQAEHYGLLLGALRQHASGDINRQALWEPILAIGCAVVTGGPAAAIIAPWHPLRMASIAAKARSVAGLAKHFLQAENVNFGDPRLFFGDLREERGHPYYPEVAVGYYGSEPQLLCETSSLNDYSLMERPVRNEGDAPTDADPREAATQVRSLIERYLDLQPHERANMSVMLYNCDAAGLPLETVKALSGVNEDEEVHCQVLVRHRDRERLGKIYTDLLERAEDDPDAVIASETSQNFMAKLRIGVLIDGGNDTSGEREVDIAFLHDVVSRQAREDWLEVTEESYVPDLLEHVPARWSYRRVTAEDELKGTSYLACPRQPAAGWSYIDAVAAVVKKQTLAGRWMPVRQISFQDQTLKSMFDEVHRTAEWVATYDDLLDKRQLLAQNIRVIRYRRQRTHGRNMIVSSTADFRILHVLVRRRLNELSLGLPDDRLDALAQKMINEALAISGDIVFRAAKQGVSAGELIGLVLSRALIVEEFDQAAASAWFLLDDYARWLGQREEGIADILGLGVITDESGKTNLRVAVSEAKYVAAPQLSDARRSSRRQLLDTLQRMEEALFGDPGRLDRDLWLSRIADLLLDGQPAMGHTMTLDKLRDGLRQGKVGIDVRGYSHIFVSGPTDVVAASEQEGIPQICSKRGLQEVFGRQKVRELVLAYEAGKRLRGIRESIGDERPWDNAVVRDPAPRVNWLVKQDGESGGDGPKDGTGSQKGGGSDKPGKPPKPPSGGGVGAGEKEPTQTHAAGKIDSTSAPGVGQLQKLIGELVEHQTALSKEEQAWLKETEQKLRSALLSYNLQAKITSTRLTPNAALIRLAGSDRLRLQDVVAQESALLTTHGLRLVHVSPLPGEIVVGVARPRRQVVSLWDVWARRELNRNDAGLNTSFVIGLRELDGEILYLNLGGPFGGGHQHEPHTLVAGSTGSGKSVLLQGLLLDIAATNPSHLARIYLIDPKMGVDYASLEHLPHLEGKVIVEQKRAIEVLESLIGEMGRRYELFSRKGARDLKTYNGKVPVAERMPMIFLFHDEFAEWMMIEDYRDAVTSSVGRLGVKARAAGIHLVFAAQRPDANVMPLQLRENLGNRLILKVASVGTSEIALGQKGAEALLGLGHLAARLSGEPDLIFAQAPYLSDEDVARAVQAIRNDDGSGRT